jgi:hypothetical protein
VGRAKENAPRRTPRARGASTSARRSSPAGAPPVGATPPTAGRSDEPPQIFLLSPATCGGERAALLLGAGARSELAERLRSPAGAEVVDVFRFLSSLYFRGKLAYARAFARPPQGLPGILVITPGDGLVFETYPVTEARLRAWGEVPVDRASPRFVEPLAQHAAALARAAPVNCRIVLLGSVATSKYVEALLLAFGPRLHFPIDFVGRGDMSRGALLLRAARAGRELPYAPLSDAARRGRRAGSSRAVPL